MDAHQVGLADARVTLVLAAGGATIAEEVLHRRDHMTAIEKLGRPYPALQSLHHGPRVAGHHLGRFRVALVGAAPAIILGYRNGRRERPLHAGDAGLQGGDATDLPQQLRIARGTQPDVVREQRGANDVALPMHGIDAEQHWNGFAAVGGIHGRVIERIGQRQPFGR